MLPTAMAGSVLRRGNFKPLSSGIFAPLLTALTDPRGHLGGWLEQALADAAIRLRQAPPVALTRPYQEAA
jgi:hypothetical protein